MVELTHAQITELFHLAFLDVLSGRVDPARYVLKGGANLRYFFGSARYSEDIDLDLNGKAPWSLEDQVDAVLGSGALRILLRVGNLSIVDFSKPKQTETTRRWKVGVGISGREAIVRTKIEFSNRRAEGSFRLEPIPSSVVAPYALRSPSVQHYTGDTPTEQKVRALAGRSETQARDVFDLDLLLRRRPLAPGSIDPKVLTEAIDRALQMPYDAFRDQVLPFLEPDALELYEGEAAWEQMQTFVAEQLEEAR
jgi:hypothetical protein